MRTLRIWGLTALFACTPWTASVLGAQQTASQVEPPRTADLSFDPVIEAPAYPEGEGPIVLVDEAHNNFHTAVGTYEPFARLLARDGFVVRRGIDAITETLESCDIFVIADAQPPLRADDPPTFSDVEVRALERWVRAGGALFVITDHMPDPGAIADLAAAFAIEVSDGYVLNGFLEGEERPILFGGEGDRIANHPVTEGRNEGETIHAVATFTGSAFRGDGLRPVLVLGRGRRSYIPAEYWEISSRTPSVDVGGWLQGGTLVHGRGRVAFFSEAAMFTAQVFDRGRVKVGMNAPLARHNTQLLLNVMHWLAGAL
jgi:hypothetical protein